MTRYCSLLIPIPHTISPQISYQNVWCSHDANFCRCFVSLFALVQQTSYHSSRRGIGMQIQFIQDFSKSCCKLIDSNEQSQMKAWLLQHTFCALSSIISYLFPALYIIISYYYYDISVYLFLFVKLFHTLADHETCIWLCWLPISSLHILF